MSIDLNELAEQLESGTLSQRREAAERLSQLGEGAQPAAARLVAHAADEDEIVCESCTSALESLGTPSADQIDTLTGLVDDGRADVAYWAATLIGRAGETAVVAVDSLVRVLDGGAGSHVKQRAAWALGQIGRPASAALPALDSAAASDDARLVRIATQAREKIG